MSNVTTQSKSGKTKTMDVEIKTVGRGHINDGKSMLRLILASEDPLGRQRILSLAGLLMNQGSKYDAAQIAEWIGITEEEVELAKTLELRDDIVESNSEIISPKIP